MEENYFYSGLNMIYPCDDCSMEGRCLRHGSCKEYQDYIKGAA